MCPWLHRGHSALAAMWRWWNTVCAVYTVLCRSFRRSTIPLSTRLAREGPRRGSLSLVSKLKVSFNSVCCERCCVAVVCRNCQQNSLLPWKQTAQVSLTYPRLPYPHTLIRPLTHSQIHTFIHTPVPLFFQDCGSCVLCATWPLCGSARKQWRSSWPPHRRRLQPPSMTASSTSRTSP